jgi:hypothetical protein
VLEPGKERKERLAAQLAAVRTRSGEYIRTLRLMLMTRTVRAPVRGCCRADPDRPVVDSRRPGSMAGYPLIQSFSRVGRPREVLLLPPPMLGSPVAVVGDEEEGTSCHRM